jgi:single-strand DNA-binding protein
MATRSWNKVELMGNLTRDPELRYTPNGAAVCTFGLATNRSYMVDGERREDVDFHKLVAWNKLAELCNQLLKKGTRVFVSGRLQYREWEGQDGVKRRDAEISIDDMIVVTPKAGTPTSGTYGEETSVDELVAAAGESAAAKATETASSVVPSDDVAAHPSDDAAVTPEEEEVKKAPAKEEKVSPDEDLPF